MTSSMTLGRSRLLALGAGAALLTGAMFAGSVIARQDAHASGSGGPAPIDRAVEASSGIRVLGAHVVGDGGIVELTYQVLDPAKASIVEGDVTKTPLITDAGNGETLHDTAAMRHGHAMRPAGTYFLLYYNKGKAVVAGDRIDITINGAVLHDVPVS